MSDLKETIKKLDSVKKDLELMYRRESGTYERYNYDILRYLREKFPEEPDTSIQEAAAFISHRTAVVIHDISAEMRRTWEKAFLDYIRKEKRV